MNDHIAESTLSLWHESELETKAQTRVMDLEPPNGMSQHREAAPGLAPAADRPAAFAGFLTQDCVTMKTVQRALHFVQSRGRMVWIEGEAGTGKSRLAHAITEALDRGPEGGTDGARTSQPAGLPGIDYWHIHAQSAFTSELGGLRACRAIFLHLDPDITAEKLRALHALLDHLAQIPTQMPQLYCMSLPSHAYRPEARQALAALRGYVVQHHFEYMPLQPLHHRRRDIPLLLDYFISRFTSLFEAPRPYVTEAAITLLQHTPLPENARDLELFCLKLVQRNAPSPVTYGCVRALLGLAASSHPEAPLPKADVAAAQPPMLLSLLDGQQRVKPLEQLQTEAIRMACQYHRGSKSAAARELGMGRTTLYRKLKGLAESSAPEPEPLPGAMS